MLPEPDFDKAPQSDWSQADSIISIEKSLKTSETMDTVILPNDTDSKPRDFSRFKVPGQYIYQGLLLGSGIPANRMSQIVEMTMQPNDVIISSYPKTGTTLLQEIVWLISNNGDVRKANQSYNYERIKFIEFTDQSEIGEFSETTRHFKTHVPHRFLPKDVHRRQNKIVYIMRNPKDTIVSYYYFYKMCIPLGNFKGTWDDFFQMFVNNEGKLYYGNMFEHMLAYWKRRDDPNLHIVFYEDILRRPHEIITSIAKFLGKNLDDDIINDIVEATKFSTMRENPRTNWSTLKHEVNLSISPFMRRGVIGDWKNHFTHEQCEIFDKMCSAVLKDSGLSFTYE